jgi:hypothetical protein
MPGCFSGVVRAQTQRQCLSFRDSDLRHNCHRFAVLERDDIPRCRRDYRCAPALFVET